MNNTKSFTVILLIFLLFCNKIHAQNTTFKYILKSDKDYSLLDIIETQDQSIYFTGFCTLPENYKMEGFVKKLNKNGELLDSINIRTKLNSFAIANILPISNNLFILNIMKSDTTNNHKNYSILLYKTDSTLLLYDKKEYSFPNDYSNFTQIMRKGIGNHILITGTLIAPVNKYRMFIYVLNNNFDSIKANVFLNEGAIFSYDIKELKTGNFWVLRGISPYEAYIDSSLVMISDKKGVLPYFMGASFGLKWDNDTSFYLAADYPVINKKNNNKIDKRDFIINKNSRNEFTDHDIGFIRQHHPFDTTGFIFNSMGAKDTFDFPASWGALDYKNKDSIFIGGTKGMSWTNPLYGINLSWYCLLQTDSMLNIRWERFYGGDAYYNMTKLIATNDGGCIMAGTRFDYINHPNLHKRDIFILKVNSEGLLTSSNGKPSPLVHNAIVYPNPGKNTIRVRVAVQYKYSLFRLFDINGKVVVSQNITGKSAIINTSFLPSGTYIYKITGKNGLYESGKWIKKGD